MFLFIIEELLFIYIILILIINIVKKIYSISINNTSVNNTSVNNTLKNNKEYITTCKYIDNIINEDLKTIKDKKLFNMCTYALKGGKRVRTVIMKQLNNNIDNDKLIFIEYLHASSLIIDDIMDKDIKRRDNDCLHIKYGITLANMTALYLMSLALMKGAKFSTKEDTIMITSTFNKLCIGQFMDVDDKKYDINKLIKYKTAVLFELSYYLSIDNKEVAKDLGLLFGKMFQLSDDFEDTHKDKKKNNYVSIYGCDTAHEYFMELYDKYNEISIKNNLNNDIISEILNNLKKKTIKNELMSNSNDLMSIFITFF